MPQSLRDFVTEYARVLGCDESYLGLCTLAVCGGAIGLTRCIQIRQSWFEFPTIWGVVVASSGTTKSPAFNFAKAPVVEIEAKFQKDNGKTIVENITAKLCYEKDLSLWRKQKNDTLPPEEPEPSPLQQLIVEDITPEKLVTVLDENRRGLVYLASELVGLFGRLGRYSGKGTTADTSFYLSLHDGSHVKVDRVNGKRVFIRQAVMSIIGTIQPGALERCIGSEFLDNGFLPRFLVVYPPKFVSVTWQTTPVPKSVTTTYNNTVRKLFHCQIDLDEDDHPVPRVVTFNRKAQTIWVEYHTRQQQSIRDSDREDITAILSKMKAQTARIALIFHEVRVHEGLVADPDKLDEISLASAIRVTDYFCAESTRLYLEVFDRPSKRTAATGLLPEPKRVLHWMLGKRDRGTEEFTVTAVSRHVDKINSVSVTAAFKSLEAAGHGTIRYEGKSVFFKLTPDPIPALPTATDSPQRQSLGFVGRPKPP